MDLEATAKALSRHKTCGLTKKQWDAVLVAVVEHWRDGLSEGDMLTLPGIGSFSPQRWKLGPQHNMYRLRAGKKPLNRKFVWRLKFDGDINLKAALRKAMSR